MIMNKFPIGFWNYTHTGDLGPKDVQDWADLGMTMANSPEFGDDSKKEDMLAILDACAEHDIKVIVCDDRARWGYTLDDPEGCEKRFLEAYEDFGKHPATLGFHLGDEPSSPRSFNECKAAHKMHLRLAPELTPHANFLPYWEGQEQTLLNTPTFHEWAVNMVKDAGLRVLCYDCYTQMNPEEEGVHQYFKNLRLFGAAAEEAGADPWTTLLSVGHFRYRVPNEDDLRWQLNSAVASGMKGILWFFIYERMPVSNYRLSPIDEFGNRTETFDRMGRVNRHFLHHFGDFFLHAKRISTYHTVKAYGGYPLFERGKSHPVILDVTCDHGLPAIVSFFEKDGKNYVAVVNNTTTESGLFKLHVPQGTKVFQRVKWSGRYTDLKRDSWDAHYSETETEMIGGDWLAPGQMKLYHFE